MALFILGLIIGAIAGIVTVALCSAARCNSCEAFRAIAYAGGHGENEVYDVRMPDGKRFRYSSGQMMPHMCDREQEVETCGEFN
ncbi:hypothetical protein [Desulfatitalea tepidiphila]|uniref:hypothetical protein n=1 Tax=Desulfatitalea tepidiphila TaxID=1185843 RepID=UPI0006B69E77|nr:hypothetical protein [Desulfatitalea tepidiphila]